MAYTKVTGGLIGSISDLDLTNVGDIQLDSITGDADTNTSITFSGSDVITIATGGSGRLTIGDGALSPVTDNQIDLGTASLEFKNAFFDGTVTADAFAGPLTTAAQSAITSVGTLTTFRSTGIDDNADALAMTIDSSERVLIGQTSSVTNGKLQVTGGIGLSGNSEIRSSTNSDNGDTIKFFGTQFVAGSNSHSYSYSEGGYIASLATAASAILLDVGNTTADTGHRFRVVNAGNGVDGSLQYIDGTTTRFHVDSSTGIIKENNIPVRSRAIAMAMVFG